MKATYQIANPDGIETTLTITMTISKWRELRSQLSDKYPSWKLGMQILDMIRKAEESFSTKHEGVG